MREGSDEAREDATLTLTAASGTTIAQYELFNAFPTNVDVTAGDPQSTSFTVQLTADDFILAGGAADDLFATFWDLSHCCPALRPGNAEIELA